MLSAIRNSIPFKQQLNRTIVSPLRNARRTRRIRSALLQIQAGDTSTELLSELRSAWGNEGFSADLRYVKETVRLASKASGPILECGTGLTTLICAVLAKRQSVELICLEQDQQWLAEVGALLSFDAKLLYTPLRQVGDVAWYDIRKAVLPKTFDLVICDGPFVDRSTWNEATFANWRYGVLPALKSAGVTFNTLLLDDANEDRAPLVLERWKREFGIGYEVIRTPDGDCAIVTDTSQRAERSTRYVSAREGTERLPQSAAAR